MARMEENNLPQLLPHRLVEMILLVGIDKDNFQLSNSDKEQEKDESLDIFKNVYEPFVLTAVSSSTMVHFHPFHIDETYPLSYFPTRAKHTTCSSKSRTQMKSPMESSAVSKFNKFRISFNPAYLRSHSSIKGQVIAAPKFPVSDEAINSLATFSFPDGVKVYSERPENYVHFLVLTDMFGSETYTSCLTFYRPHIMDVHDGNLHFTLETAPKILESGQSRCYFPNCLLLISKYPYYTVLKDCLSSLITLIEKDQEDMYTFIKEYAHKLIWTPVPPAGDVAIEFNLCQMNLTLNPPDHFEKPVIDIPMHLTFLCFPVEEILRIITCILVEERILFLTTNYALLTIVMESFRNFILPFRWRFTYVPVLSSKSLGFLQAPGTFMFGCHSRHKEEAEEIEGLVMVDIDTGMVKINPDETGKVKNIPVMPLEPANVFKSKCRQTVMEFTLMDINRPFIYNMEELHQRNSMKMKQCNSTIASSCLELMVNLFRDIIFDTSTDLGGFKRYSFLERKNESEKEFYERVSKSDMFKVFLRDRVNKKADYWSDIEMRTRKEAGVAQNPTANPVLWRRRLCKRPSSVDLISQIAFPCKDFVKFKLPDGMTAEQYVKNCLVALNKALKEYPNYGRVSLQYLRGLFHVANGDNIAALDDLINFPATSVSQHHARLLHDIYQKLTEKETQKISEKSYYCQLSDILKMFNLHEAPHVKFNQSMDHIFDLDNPLGFEDFANGAYELEMSNDYDTICRLYEALTTFKIPLDPRIFQSFYANWEANQKNSHCIISGDFDEDETILKVSEVIKTNFGIGRMGLTDKRLFFLKNVSNDYKEIIRLRNITKIKKTQAISYLSAVDVLQISANKKTIVFTAWLKEERNWWYMLIQEMWSGKIVSMETKDLAVISQAAQNVLLMDAVIWSQLECTSTKDLEKAALKLAYYTDSMNKNYHKMSKVTFEALQHRLDPNMGNRVRKTVHSLLYTNGDGCIQPRLWCGMSDGKIKVYNGINWILENESIETKNCVLCLTAVGKKHVWAGSNGIFIIDTETITCNKTLMDRSDQVVGIVVTEDGKMVFVAYVSGTILKWDIQTLTVEQPPISLGSNSDLLSLKIYNDHLWLGTWKKIIVVDMMGNTVHEFSFNEENHLIDLNCFIKPINKELWVGCRREGHIFILDLETGNYQKVVVPNTNGICCMIKVEKEVWIGTKSGTICLYNIESNYLCRELEAHKDTVRVICRAHDRYVISGSGSKDGKISLWSASMDTIDSGSYHNQ